jgi:arylformamidase
MLLYDVTRPLAPSLPVYPGDPAVEIVPIAQQSWGDVANVSRVVLTSHSGTHIDAPRHFFEQGMTVDALNMHTLIGPARVYDMAGTSHISIDDVHGLDLRGITRVLFKTTNSTLWEHPDFQPDYIALTASAAQRLADDNVRLVGIDYLSVDAFDASDFPVHRTLLSTGVIILEGLDLRHVPPGDYDLYALPLLLAEGDGAPARVVLQAHGS